MILQRLVEHYDRLAADARAGGALPRPGYSLQKVSFCVVLHPDGRLNSFESLLDGDEGKKHPRELLVPGQAKPPGSGINPCFLWDNAAYMLGHRPDDPSDANLERTRERTQNSFEAFRQRHLEAESAVSDPAFSAVCTFLRNWRPELAGEFTAVLQEIAGSFGVFRIAGETRFVHDRPLVSAYHARLENASNEAGEVTGFCLVTGKQGPVARLHEPKIKNVRGAQAAGALLVSFNDPAYTSYGKDQSYNAPVGVPAVFKYANALNYLLNRRDRRIYLGDATVTFWAEQATRLEEFVSDLFDEPPAAADAPEEDQERVRQARLFLSQLREGAAAAGAMDEASHTRFFILGLSPNASRVSIRFWTDTTVAELQQVLARHLSDIELVGARTDAPLTVKRMVLATGRAEFDPKGRFTGKYDAKNIPPALAGAVARAVLTGGAYPRTLLAAMLNRLRSDGEVNHPRLAAIKACLNRNSRLHGNFKEVTVALDKGRNDAAYVTGRLFALLEKAQKDSVDGELNATIKDRYFSSASMTPNVVFPRLLRLNQFHLAKMETGRKIYFEKQIDEVMGKLRNFDRHFNIENQGLFAIGYFHQHQDLYTSRKGDPEGGLQ